MRFTQIKLVLKGTLDGIIENHLFLMAAGLSYYFIISLFPALVLFFAVAAYFPVSNVSDKFMGMLSGFIPSSQLTLIATTIQDVVKPNRNILLSIGLLGVLWTASSGFASLMTAIGIAYGAPDLRPFWKTRPIALGLTVSVGILFLIGFGVMTVGPHFGNWLANGLGLSQFVALLWPYVRWALAVACSVLAVELLYLIAPSVKQGFYATLPGAILSVGVWLALTFALSTLFQGPSKYHLIYGSLGGAVAFMAWVYWVGFALLLGAQLNAEIEKIRTRQRARPQPILYRWPESQPPPSPETSHRRNI